MDIPRCHFKIYDIIIFVTTGIGCISEHLLVFPFMEPATVRIGSADLFVYGLWRGLFFFQWLFSMLQPVLLYFLQQLLFVTPGFFFHGFILVFMRVCTGFDVGAIDKKAFRIQETTGIHLH